MAVNDWKELTDLTGGERIVVERVRLSESGVAIEGEFEPPDLARLPAEDQVFVMTFVQVHGSIKEMERLFGISYPTVKKRLDSIASKLEFVVDTPAPNPVGDDRRSEIVDQLYRGEMSVEEAVARLSP